MTTPTLGFEIVSKRVGDSQIRTARFSCTKCNATHDQGIPGKLVPEALANTLKNKGWAAHASHANRTLCPLCNTKAKITNDTDSEIKKMTEKLQAETAMASGVVPPHNPTVERRARIREMLNEHFDELDGCYLDDYSDQVIAEKLGVSDMLVEKIREAAYGPIRVTPEMQALRKDVQNFMKRLAETQDMINAILPDLDKLREDSTSLHAKMQKLV